MLRGAFLLLLAGCAGSAAPAQRPSPKGALVPRDTVEALKRIEQEIGAANIRRDKAYFAQVEADEFRFTDANGGITTKAEDIAGLDETPTSTLESYVADSMTVRVYGSTAVVWGRVTMSGRRAGGSRFSVQSRFTDVFVVRNGRWQLVAGHSSRLPPPEA